MVNKLVDDIIPPVQESKPEKPAKVETKPAPVEEKQPEPEPKPEAQPQQPEKTAEK
jgi:hypothetical protein